MPLPNLPLELVLEIVSYLPPSTKFNIRGVSTAWNHLATALIQHEIATYDTHRQSDSARDVGEVVHFQHDLERYKRHRMGFPYAVLGRAAFTPPEAIDQTRSQVVPLLVGRHLVHMTYPDVLRITDLRADKTTAVIKPIGGCFAHVLTNRLYAYVDSRGLHILQLTTPDKSVTMVGVHGTSDENIVLGGQGWLLVVAQQQQESGVSRLLLIDAQHGNPIVTDLTTADFTARRADVGLIKHVIYDAEDAACHVLTQRRGAMAIRCFRLDTAAKTCVLATFKLSPDACDWSSNADGRMNSRPNGRKQEWLMEWCGYQALVRIDSHGVRVCSLRDNSTPVTIWKGAFYVWDSTKSAVHTGMLEQRIQSTVVDGPFHTSAPLSGRSSPMHYWNTSIVTHVQPPLRQPITGHMLLVNDSYLVDFAPGQASCFTVYCFDPALSSRQDPIGIVGDPATAELSPVRDLRVSAGENEEEGMTAASPVTMFVSPSSQVLANESTDRLYHWNPMSWSALLRVHQQRRPRQDEPARPLTCPERFRW